MPLSKEKKRQSKNANGSGREAAVTPAAVGSDKDLEFSIETRPLGEYAEAYGV